MLVQKVRSVPMTKFKRRTFSAEFKAQVVLEVISGVKTFSEACRQYQLGDQTLSRWKEEFLQNAPVVFERQSQSEQEHERVAE
jgi:transposase